MTDVILGERWVVGSHCHCGEPDECWDHWMVHLESDGIGKTVVAERFQRRAHAEYVAELHNATLAS